MPTANNRVRNIKRRTQPQDYNSVSQQNPNHHQNTKDFIKLKKKLNSILILTDSMLKTLRMGELNQFCKKKKLSLNLFPKQKQYNLTITQLQF